jgi:hypothetical protein
MFRSGQESSQAASLSTTVGELKIFIEDRVRLATAEAHAYTEHRVSTGDEDLRAALLRFAEERTQLATLESQAYNDQLREALGEASRKFDAVRQHLPEFLNALASVAAMGHELVSVKTHAIDIGKRISALEERLNAVDASISRLRSEAEERHKARC